MTLTHSFLPSMTRLQQVMLVLGGTVFIALAAQLSVPMLPVPMTLQTLAILIVGLTFGARLGAATLITYLAQGAAGLPVFAGGAAGMAYMVGPTFGFLLGYVFMAWLAGLAVEKGLARGFLPTALVALVASAALYLPGIAWPMGIAGLFGIEASWTATNATAIWAGWVSPFLLGDALKAIIAALVVSGGWAALRSRKA